MYDALNACLIAIEAGVSLDQALNEYPEFRDELQPLLEVAIKAGQLRVGEIPIDALNRSRTQALSRAATLSSNQKNATDFLIRLPRLATAVLLVLLLVLGGGSLVSASAQSLPGDQLYQVKRAVENIRLEITINGAAHQKIEANFQKRRLSEVKQLIAQQRQEAVSFDGQVIHQGDDRWLIEGIVVVLTPETIIIGEIVPGMVVEVEGITQPAGWVQALEIHLRSFKFTGVVESISPDIWIVSGEEIPINAETYIGSNIQVGQWVLILIRTMDDGQFLAQTILSETRLPTNTPQPISTPTEDSDDTVVETEEPDPELEIEDDSTDEPEDSVGADETDEPDETDKPDGPDKTDHPDETEKPDETDEPDEPEE